jgi:peptide/nickel transport system permease protein
MAPGFYLLLALRAAVPDTFNSVQVYFSIVVILSVIGWAGLARVFASLGSTHAFF